jgi:nucleoside phosphorylase
VYLARIGDVEICAALTGIGCHNARRVVRPLFEFSPAVCVCSGLAGGLKSEHRSQQVLVAKEIRRDGSPRAIKSHEKLVALAVDCGAKPVNLIHTSERILHTAAEKQRMGADADAVDMESFVVVQEASARGIPAVAIRAVADTMERDLPLDFHQLVGEQGDIKFSRVLGGLARNPRRAGALARFGFESLRAATSLARFLDRYLDALADWKKTQESLPQAEVG